MAKPDELLFWGSTLKFRATYDVIGMNEYFPLFLSHSVFGCIHIVYKKNSKRAIHQRHYFLAME